MLRHHKNPILTPKRGNSWESKMVFNPGAYFASSKVHLLYRAVDENDISYIGYASSIDGLNIDERSDKPVITPEYGWERMGVEDPRVTGIDGRIYVTYTALSEKGARIAIAETSDLHTFKKMGLIGPDHYDKDAVLFPKRIDGRIVLLHRIAPNIQIAYFRSIQEVTNPPEGYWEEYLANLEKFTILRPKYEWELAKIGAGPPPIETESGWLLIYHGVNHYTGYRVGAALLDLDDPSKVLARTANPILEPLEWYERWGRIPEIVFPTGAVIVKDLLYLYYGAADTTCCVATANVHELLHRIKSGS